MAYRTLAVTVKLFGTSCFNSLLVVESHLATYVTLSHSFIVLYKCDYT